MADIKEVTTTAYELSLSIEEALWLKEYIALYRSCTNQSSEILILQSESEVEMPIEEHKHMLIRERIFNILPSISELYIKINGK